MKTVGLKNVIDDLKKASTNAVNSGHESIQKFLERYTAPDDAGSSGTSSGVTGDSQSDRWVAYRKSVTIPVKA